MKTRLLLCLLTSSIGFSQNFIPSVSGHYGTSSGDNLGQTIKCEDGGFLMIASSNGNDIDKTGPNYGGSDVWVLRLNSDKTIRWEKTFGGTQNDYPRSIVELEDGTILLLGNSFSGVSGNKTSINYGNTDYWLLKLTSTGDKIWDQSYGSSGIDGASGIFEISPTNYLIVGGSNGGVSGSKTEASFGNTDIWVIAVDSSGANLWQKSYGGSDFDGASEQFAVQLENDNILLLAASESGVSGNKTTPQYGSGDAWGIEMNPADGQIIQQNSIGGSEYDCMYRVVQHNGSIYIAGFSSSGISGNKESTLHGNTDAWLLKLDNNLSVVSDQSFGGTLNCRFTGIVSTSTGLIAYGQGRNDNNPWLTDPMNGARDSWLVGFDHDGNYQWNYTFGTVTDSSPDELVDLFENNTGSFTFSFVSNSPGNDGDLTVLSHGNTDLYLVDLDTDLSVSNLSEDPFSIYPNPVTNSFSINGLSESAAYEITDLQGKIMESGIYNGKIDAAKFNAGLYTIRIVSGSQTVIKKWIKN